MMLKDRYSQATSYSSDESYDSDGDPPSRSAAASSGMEELDLKEQVYRDKKNEIMRKLEQLDAGTLPEYVGLVKQAESEVKLQTRIHEIKMNMKITDVETQHRRVKSNALKEFEDLKDEAVKNVLSDIHERKRQLMREKDEINIWNYHTREEKPKSTRSLRRRVQDSLPNDDKQKKSVTNIVDCTLTQSELAEDMRSYMRRGRALMSSNQFDNKSLLELPYQVKVEEDKLMYGERSIYKGQNLVLEIMDKGSVNVVVGSIDGRDSTVVFRKLGGGELPVTFIELELGVYRIRK